MLTVTEPQVWTLIGVFAAMMFGMLTIVSTLFVRVLRVEIGSLRTEMTSRIDNLDRDVQALVKHTFGIDRG
ncbi:MULTISPECIES: hypothetical protein [unclassified Microbacterium]|uniref:hypothetical protein n=1 Tax=unclassified Microbacterium TaxID=2609290 RepID=UPI001F0BAB68|nr:hypothetical protein [Microbacterium sp. Gd 4-13]